MHALELPTPSDEDIQHSQALCEHIINTIEAAGGWISFEQYMQLALYAPNLGYYSGGAQKFGEQGDFITSPEVSPLFAQTLARPISEVLSSLDRPCIIEFGAGSGKLAVDLLRALQALDALPETYFIIELSAALQQRQKELIAHRAPQLLPRVRWLSHLPTTPIEGLILANEVLDAMPVTRFELKDGVVNELGVEVCEGALQLSYREASVLLTAQVIALGIEFDIKGHGYSSEINTYLAPWIAALSASMEKGAVYLIDYGYPRAELYSEDRHMGSFLGYYRHRAMDAPLWYPGLQDLTAFVDFTAVAQAAIDNGFDVDGFTSQGNFLVDAGITHVMDEALETAQTDIEHLQWLQQMKTLSMPGEMGERFKVMGLSKAMAENIPGFSLRDFRYRL